MQENISEITLVLIAGSVIVLLLAVVIIFSLFTNQKRRFLHQQQMEEQKKIFEQEILRTQLEIQTQTFETISRELHDNVSNTLSLALLNLNLVEDSGEDKTERLAETKNLVLEAKRSVKDFSWSIDPENISKAGLIKSIEQLAQRSGKIKQMNITHEITGEEFQLESSKQIIIYRIVQESLSNVLKHTEANEVFLKIEFADPYLKIMIRDNGCGFNVDQIFNAPDNRGAGLKNMLTRARMINGELEIKSEPGSGTTIILSYPAEKKRSF